MTEALRHCGFGSLDVVLPATREQILAGFERLIADTRAGDAVVVYYSGHGSKIQEPRAGLGEIEYYRFLLPSDFEESTEDDFRGYTNIELSLNLAALTRKTQNVTVIMDCCFAGRVFRNASGTAEQIEWQDTSRYQPTRYHESKGRWIRAAARHYALLRETKGLGLTGRDSEANPYAVQLLASTADGKAYEAECPPREDCSHTKGGAMTLALHHVLMKVDPDRTSWQELGRTLRMTPRRSGHDQRVAIEGPFRRLLFRLEEREELGAVELDLSDGRILLAGGRLAGLSVGDTYELVVRGANGAKTVVGEATVDVVASSHATVRTDIATIQLGSGCWARPLRHGKARAIIELVGFDADTAERELLAARIRASGLLHVLEPGRAEQAGELPHVARMQFDSGHLRLWSGRLAFDVARRYHTNSSPAQARRLADHMADAAHRLARQALMRKTSEDTLGDLDGDWELTWARVQAGKIGVPLAARGERLQAGECVTVRLRTVSAPLYLSVFMLHADGCIELLSRAQGGGIEVLPDTGGYILGRRSLGPIRGVELRRPPNSVLATDAPLETSIVAVVSDKAVDLRSWEQRGISRFSPSDPLDPASSNRNFPAPTPRVCPARYQIFRCDFALLQPSESAS